MFNTYSRRMHCDHFIDFSLMVHITIISVCTSIHIRNARSFVAASTKTDTPKKKDKWKTMSCIVYPTTCLFSFDSFQSFSLVIWNQIFVFKGETKRTDAIMPLCVLEFFVCVCTYVRVCVCVFIIQLLFICLFI